MNEPKKIPIVSLGAMTDGQEADTFVLLTAKEEGVTKHGKPYFRVTMRDSKREIQFPVWQDSICANDCRDLWKVGGFYKLRAVYKESSYGPQLEVQKSREANDGDRNDGFDETLCQARSQFDPQSQLQGLLDIAAMISDPALSNLVIGLLNQHKEQLLKWPAAMINHHAFVGGYLEHVHSVTRNALLLADKYVADYPEMRPPLSRDLVIAGAILHDIGKLLELETTAVGAHYTPAGELIGHILIGRDMVRDAARDTEIDPEILLRLEHIIVSHQRLPEWGSPKQPMTPEALIVHYADDLDANFQMMYTLLQNETGSDPMTARNFALRGKVFRGFEPDPPPADEDDGLLF